ncbi:MAG: ricin-type beta-trefoil lectin domain protein [Polyangiaceae bacterium]|nr:ricin-type beta-trefoil lectin domain protein [Polyangiaceae bacterium]
MNSSYQMVALGAFGLSAFGCGASADEGADDWGSDDNVGRTSSAIIQGTPVANPELYHGAAVYHQFVRPCSATRLTPDGWYLTARHCVTQDPYNPRGPLLSPSQISVSEAANPGLTPPAGAVTVQRILDHDSLDAALIKAPGITNTYTNYPSLYVAPRSTLVGRTVVSTGYGRSVLQSDRYSENGTSGAGSYRAAWLDVTGEAGTYAYWLAVNGSGQITASGDSGGSSLYPYLYRWISFGHPIPLYAWQMAGVHEGSDQTASANDVAVSVLLPWLNQHVDETGWFYLRLVNTFITEPLYVDVPFGATTRGVPIWSYRYTGGSAQHWRYDPATRSIRNQGGQCLDVQWGVNANGTPVWTWDCNGEEAQQWDLTGELEIRNTMGRCLDVPSSNFTSGVQLQIWDCNGTLAQKWELRYAR